MKSIFIKSLALIAGIISMISCTGSDSKIEAPLVYPNPYKVLEDLNTINENTTLKMLNRTTAISVGQLGYIITTTDQGVTWQKLDAKTTNNLNDISFTSEQSGWVVGNGAIIKKTRDQGATWTDKVPATLLATENVLAVNLFNENLGACTTATGKILITKDGGTTWVIKSAKATNEKDIVTALRAIYIKDATTFYIVGAAGVLLKTTNFGDTFTIIPTSQVTNVAAATFYRIAAPSQNVAYSCGSNGIVLKINLANDALTLINPPMTETMQGINFLTDNLGYVVGRFGLIFKTEDSGASWSRMKSGVSVTLTDVAYWNDSLGYVAGSKTILKTKQE
ncbi:WD40/YVTN/BNR-like repeat-containing protein [Flavobacterium collinsii]|uniref:Ycf48-like protein n=1 Tax=Flavobacterium collinsii TaxID=1114861 RepID=A0ABM8KKV2_9FLAO|nr:YCF48-related protein [Flavobacterium collinsii]CAA9199513.1 Ycf48-like protein [Flavobacterium collinsii]